MRRRLTWLACSLGLLGCGQDERAPTPGSGDAPWVPPPETCEAPNLDDPRATLTPGGQVWPAISASLTWGYARSELREIDVPILARVGELDVAAASA